MRRGSGTTLEDHSQRLVARKLWVDMKECIDTLPCRSLDMHYVRDQDLAVLFEPLDLLLDHAIARVTLLIVEPITTVRHATAGAHILGEGKVVGLEVVHVRLKRGAVACEAGKAWCIVLSIH